MYIQNWDLESCDIGKQISDYWFKLRWFISHCLCLYPLSPFSLSLSLSLSLPYSLLSYPPPPPHYLYLIQKYFELVLRPIFFCIHILGNDQQRKRMEGGNSFDFPNVLFDMKRGNWISFDVSCYMNSGNRLFYLFINSYTSGCNRFLCHDLLSRPWINSWKLFISNFKREAEVRKSESKNKITTSQ